MLPVDKVLLRDPVRLEAVEEARRLMTALPVLVDEVAAAAARCLAAPVAVVSLVGEEKEFLAGVYDVSGGLGEHRHRSTAHWAGQYVVSADRPVRSPDIFAEDDPALRCHPLLPRRAVRALLSVPLPGDGGATVGCLTVVDVKTRQWSDKQSDQLDAVASLLRPHVLATAHAPSGALDGEVLLDSVQEAFLAVDRDGLVVTWNRAAQQLLGFTPAEVCGRHLDDSLLPDYDGQPIGTALSRLFLAAPRRRVSRKVVLQHRDGHRLTAQASLSVLPGSAGPMACVFLTDLSGQVAAEKSAEHNDRFLDALLDSLSVGVIACDGTGRVVLVNRALRDVQALPSAADVPDDYADTASKALVHPDMTPMSWDQTPLMRAFRGEHVQASDVLIQAPGHRLRTFTTTAQPITSRHGRPLGAVAVAHEVTAVRRAEQFRECHLAVVRALAAADSPQEAADGVLPAVAGALRWPLAELWLIDEATDSLHCIGRWSRPGLQAGDLAGHSVVKGVGFTGRVWSTGQPVWVSEIADAPGLRRPQTRTHTEACMRLGIHTVLAVPICDGDTVLGVLTCYADAPEHHQDLLTVLLDGVAAQFGVFVALRRAAALGRQLDRSRDDFIALVGHELRTPLTSIAANAALLNDDLNAFSDDHQQMVQAISRNTTALQSIVNTLLDLAGLDAGHVALTVQPVDLVAITTAAITAAQTAAGVNGVRLDADLPATMSLDGDATRLRQVLDDLLSNAVKYSPHGGDVHIRLSTDGDRADLEITDDGIGVLEHETDHLFDRFYRGEAVRHHGTPGNGLGLSMARTIVHLHHGTITVTPRQPTGTTVLVRLPLGDQTTDR